jgi:predicted TIM-barrel fold metal-dependent hydrolase
MFIVDSQVHLWLDESPDRPWVKGARERLIKNGHRTDAFTYEECLQHMDKAGVDRVMIVPGSWEGDRIDYALKACEAHPDRFAVMARIPQNKPAEAMAMLKDWQSIPYVKGTRITFHRPIDRNWMIDGTMDWYWPFAEKHNINTMIHAPIWKRETGEVAKKHPGLKLIIDHMGIFTRMMDDAIEYWVEETIELADNPNIYVKVSAIPSYSSQPYPFENVNKYVRMVVDAFGAKRCFWGTDLTRQLNHGMTYTDCIEHFTKHMGFSQEQLEWIMGRGISECLNWPATR